MLKRKHYFIQQNVIFPLNINWIYQILIDYIYRHIMIKFGLVVATVLLLCSQVYTAEKNYTTFVNEIKQKITEPSYKHSAWNRLAELTDNFGPRMWGSNVLEMAIDWMKKQAEQIGFENIRLEPVSDFTKWVRGKQSLYMTSPRHAKLDVIGLGASYPTNGVIEAQVIVVKDYDELDAVQDKVPGKIVCFNNKWIDYQHSVTYRVEGPSKAAKYGALATLVRSVASSSIYSVHTGYMEYDEKISTRKIPCAAITVEDAQMFNRMQDRGQVVKVKLSLQSQFVPHSNSHNLVFEIKGSQFPEQIVLAGGHIDTWDTGSQTGANDDGGGFITVFEALRMLKENNYRPRRTLRFIAWSGEQSGSYIDGAAQYMTYHKDQIKYHVAAFESDLGSTKLLGFGHQGSGEQIVKGVLTDYMSILGAGDYKQFVSSVDVMPLGDQGVPTFDNKIFDTPDHSYYFRYHHTAGDSMSMMDPDDMDSNVAGFAAFLYIIADLQKTVRDVPALIKDNLRTELIQI